MRKILNAIVVIPLALIFLAFALANRRLVVVSFNPFDSSDPALALSLPLFIVIILAAILGVVAGGMAVWFGQRHWRRAARRHEADAADARRQLADMRVKQTPPIAPYRPGISAQPGGVPLAIGQDK